MKSYRIEISIFVVALLLRVLFVLTFGQEQRLYDSLNDQVIYLDIAHNLAAGNGYAVTNPIFTASAGPTSIEAPGMSYFLAGMLRLFGESYLPIRLVQAVLGALICVVAYWIGVRTIGQRPAILGGFILAVYPTLIMFVRPLMPETLSILLMALAVLWTLRLLDQLSVVNGVVAAVFWALAYLTRPEAGVYAVAMALYALVIFWRKYRQKFAFGFPYVLPGGVAFLLVLAPWLAWNYQIHGEMLLGTSLTGMNFWEYNYLRYYHETEPDRYPAGTLPEKIDIPNFDRLTELERDGTFMALANDFISHQPLKFAYYGLTRVLMSFPVIPHLAEFTPPPPRTDGYDYTSLDEYPLYNDTLGLVRVWSFRLLFVCAVIGTLLALRDRKYAVLLFVLLVVFNVASAFLIKGAERPRLIVDPYWILLSAYFLLALYDRFRQRPSSQVIQ